MSGEVVLTRDMSSGRVHKRYLTETGSLASLEADNLDQAGAYEVIAPDALDAAEPGDLCVRCFPAKEGSE